MTSNTKNENGCAYHPEPEDFCFECARVYVINEIAWIDAVIMAAEKSIDRTICRLLQICEEEYYGFAEDVINVFREAANGDRLRGIQWEAEMSIDKKSITFFTAHNDDFGGRYCEFEGMVRLEEVQLASIAGWPVRD